MMKQSQKHDPKDGVEMNEHSLEQNRRCGVIGAGEIAFILLPMLKNSPMEIVGITDLDTAKAEQWIEAYGSGVVYESAEALLADPRVDVVYIATPPSSHRFLIEMCAEAQKDIVCEKPLVETSEEFRLCQQRLNELSYGGKTSCCSSRFRFTPAAEAVKEAVQGAELGDLIHVQMKAQVAPPKESADVSQWKLTARSGELSNWGVYEIEWLCGTLGERFQPVRVKAQFSYWKREDHGVETSYFIMIECKNGLSVSIERVAQVGPPSQTIDLRGTKGGLSCSLVPSEDPLQKYSLGEDGAVVTESLALPAGDWGRVLIGPIVDLACSDGQGEGLSDIASQSMVHELIDAIYRSAQEGCSVELGHQQTSNSSSS